MTSKMGLILFKRKIWGLEAQHFLNHLQREIFGLYINLNGQFDKVISEFNKAIELNPRDAEAHTGRGIAYAEGKGQLESLYLIGIGPKSFSASFNNSFHLAGSFIGLQVGV